MADSPNKTSSFDAHFLETISTGPGVYQMLSSKEVLYVGKAKNLKKRLAQYVHYSGSVYSKTAVMLSHVKRVETVLTTTEKEALILEASFIKQHRPRYNVILRDDKNYPLIKVTTAEEWPRITVTRKRLKDKNRYFGPYAATSAMRTTLKLLYTMFPLRRCRIMKHRERPCLNFQMKRCLAPCTGNVSHTEYMKSVNAVVKILEGKVQDVAVTLKDLMLDASNDLQFEKAALYRDQLKSLQKTIEHQAIVATHHSDQDIYGLFRKDAAVGIAIIFVRGGIITGVQSFFIPDPLGEDEVILTKALLQYYSQQRIPPREILLPIEIEDLDLVAEHLEDLSETVVKLLIPKKGKKMQLMKIAYENAAKIFSNQEKKDKNWQILSEALMKKLHLVNSPNTIECLDISNLQGKQAVGSLVHFEQGEKNTRMFRHYRIKEKDTPDDYAMMEEVLIRRFDPQKKNLTLPDMLLLDGGKGQLSKAVSVLQPLGLLNKIDLVAIAKEKKAEGEKLFRPGRKNPILLAGNAPPLLYLMRIRDESHRFGITFHRKLRQKETLVSELDVFTGIGRERKKWLLKHFGSVKKIKNASVEDLCSVKGIGPQLANKIHNQMQNK